MKTQILKTGEKTINKKVKATILDLLLPEQTITKVKKMHVAGVGYVMDMAIICEVRSVFIADIVCSN